MRTSLSLAAIEDWLRFFGTVVVLAGGLAVLLALVLGFFLARHFIQPLSSMTGMAESMTRGDFGQRMPLRA